MSVSNPDLRAFRLRPAAGVLPPGVTPNSVYALPVFTPAQMTAFRAEAQREVAAALAVGGGGLGGAAVVAAPAAIPGAPPAVPAGAVAVSRVAGQLQWLAAENRGGYRFGDVVSGIVSVPVEHGRLVHVLPDGQSIFVQCVDGGKVDDFLGVPALSDHRILPVKYNAMGVPERSLAEVAATCREEPVKWTLPGPRTAKWCVTYLSVEAIGFEAHHERLRSLCKLEPNSWGVQEHFQLSMTLRHALQIDQVDGFNLVFVEVMFRRLQTIEYAHSERAREAESKSVGGRLSIEEQQTFGGLVRHAATLMICPTLLDHVKSEVEKEVGLQKNMRKIREEREAARKSGNKSKKQGEGEPLGEGVGSATGASQSWTPVPLFEMAAEDRKPRNLFPLPVSQPQKRLPRQGLSRGCARRLLRGNAVEAEVHNTVQCLNALYSGGDIGLDDQAPFLGHGASLAQVQALEFVKQSVHAMGTPPEDLSRQGAHDMLRATGVYGGDQAPSALGSYNPALLSLPNEGNVPVPLEDLWGEGGHEFVGTFIRNVILPESVAKSKIQASGLRHCYSDPLLRHPRTFSQLVKRLHDCGLVTYSLEPSKSYVELFFVKKKNGMLRMVVDCRHSNEWFAAPIGVALSTGDALSRIELEPNQKLYFASADLKDAFYHLELPHGIRHLFGLRGVRAGDIGLESVNGVPVPWHQTIYPQLSAVPMGWTWALYLCQTLHERIVGQSVRRELSIWYGIAPLLWKDLSAEWSTTIYATDASDWGSGVTTSTMDSLSIRELGRYAERWRFKDDRWRYPRRSSPSLFSADEADDVVAHGWDQHNDTTQSSLPDTSGVQFVPLPFSAVDRPWKVVGRWKWKRQESMPILEARATLFAVKHMVRSTSNYGKRILVFSDSMTAVASISRGRAHSRGLRRVVQQIAALCLCSSVCIHTRWCPSEWNPADSPSRGGWAPSTPQQHLDHGDSQVPRCQASSGPEPVFESSDKQKIKSKNSASSCYHASSTAGSADSVTMVFSDGSNKIDIPEALGSVLELGNSEPPGSSQQRGSRQGSDAVLRRTVPGRKRPEHGSLCGGFSDVCATRSSKSGNAKVAGHQAKPSGLAEPLSAPKQTAGALGGCVSCQCMGFQKNDAADGGWASHDVHPLSRPSEMCRLKVRDVVFPNRRLRRNHQKTVVTLHSFEDGIPSKTHEFDETIELDLPHHQFLTHMLQDMISKLRLQKESLLFNLEAVQVREFLQEAQEQLRIHNIGPLHPYRWRHGGASTDFWEKHRDLAAIQKRGRWRAMASVRRYEKGGRLAQLLSKLPDATQELANWASENVEQAYYNPRLLNRIP
eukprot:Skav235998  [mRNA]  locus=scaffold348:388416:392834:+ [translate_table: standard]